MLKLAHTIFSMCNTLIQVRVFGAALDGFDVVVPVSKDGHPPPVTWVNRTRLAPDRVIWPGVIADDPREELAGPLWTKYALVPDPDHPDDRQPWRYTFVRDQDGEPDFWDWIDNL